MLGNRNTIQTCSDTGRPVEFQVWVEEGELSEPMKGIFKRYCSDGFQANVERDDGQCFVPCMINVKFTDKR